MLMPRFSLRWLLLFVAFFAIAVFSLRYASRPISDCLSAAWFTVLLLAIFGVVYRRGRQRAFWLGCCVFGWSFAAYSHLLDDTLAHRAIDWLPESTSWSVESDSETLQAHLRNGGTTRGGPFAGRPTFQLIFPRKDPFERAVRALLGVMIAVVGGLAAQWFQATEGGTASGHRETLRAPGS
jgi:hypothetical protein